MAKDIKTGGRQKGTNNKVTQGAVANIMSVFEMLGGAQGFAQWATDNQTEFYKHYAKLIPMTVNAELSGSIMQELVYTIVKPA